MDLVRTLPAAWLFAALATLFFSYEAMADDDERRESYVRIDKAEWQAERHRLVIAARGAIVPPPGEYGRIEVRNAGDGSLLAQRRVSLEDRGDWETTVRHTVEEDTAPPCRILILAGGASAERDVDNRPTDCVGGGNLPPVADAGADQTIALPNGQGSVQVTLDGSGSNDPDGSIAAYLWSGTPTPADETRPTVTLAPGEHVFSLRVRDDRGALSAPDETRVTVNTAPTADRISINSTSHNSEQLQPPVGEQPFINAGNHALLAANDLGMHCADLDFQVFSILPPFNGVRSQVVLKGTGDSLPRLLDDSDVEVVYSAAANPHDPALADPAMSPVFKSNFWSDPDGDGRTFGYDGYAPLYFGLLLPTDIANGDTGLPVPDSALLRDCLEGYLSGAEGPEGPRTKCGLTQATMPGRDAPYASNEPIPFDRFDHEINFFNELLGGLGLGGIITDTNWFAADGIPMKPVDDSGRVNSYPLLRVQARDKNTGEVLTSTDVVTPVASEADCQLCHAPALDCSAVDPQMQCLEHALARTPFRIMTLDGDGAGEVPPGDTLLQRLLNVAKINILRVHDAKHGTTLDESRPVQCATCHYSPALDLAQLGPTDSPNTDQTNHITMSRAMHGHHGELTDDSGAPLFPAMPDPVGRNPSVARQVLEQTCYACHPGKRTQCLRGAMAAGGVVCQDCHGDMLHVGNDFSENLAHTPWPAGANLNKRVPWASEPGCQSCHTGDALDSLAGTVAAPVAADGIRLLKAFTIQAGMAADGTPDGTETAVPIQAVNKRFAENETLYRLSKGHGGLMCEGCHGSTHAIFPNPMTNANDNIAAIQLQGHRGTIIECTVCHAAGSLPPTLDGPHGMHPVGDARWNRGHEDIAESNPQACQACHGTNGEGTVLSRTATERELVCKDAHGSLCTAEGQHILVAAQTQIGCAQCHENKAGGED